MDYVLIGIIGLMIGSFLNVCIYRIPREESIAYPPSHCEKCGHKLTPFDLIPLFSYIFLNGRCRYCGGKISTMYPIVEILNGILFLAIYFRFGLSILTLKYFVLTSLLVVISIIDFKTQFIYTSTTIFGGIAGVVFIIIQTVTYQEGVANYILGGAIGFVIIGIIVFLTKGMGEGDIEIALVCGLFLGAQMILLDLLIGIMIGGIIGIIILILKLKNAKDQVAFGPFIAIGAIIAMLYGNELMQMYLKLFV